MYFSSAALSFLGYCDHCVYDPQRCPFLCASSKELEQHIWKPQSALKSLSGRDLADAVELPCVLLLCSVSAMVYDL